MDDAAKTGSVEQFAAGFDRHCLMSSLPKFGRQLRPGSAPSLSVESLTINHVPGFRLESSGSGCAFQAMR